MNANLPAQYQPSVLAAQMHYAKALAASSLLPRQYQGQPANLLWAISYGQTLGVDPMTAVQSIHVIQGRPTASADLIAGLVRRAGHRLRVVGDDQHAEAVIIRADDPEFEFRAVWTIERARQAGLLGKETWRQFPAAMLKARAITEVARAACSEILQGTIYTPEELGAYVDQDGNPVDAPVQPLRAVQQNGPQAPEREYLREALDAPEREYLREALDAPDAGTVRRIWQEARAFGSHPDYLDQIAEVGRKKAAAAAEGDVPDAEVVEEDEHAEAVRRLREAAEQAGLPEAELEEQFHASYGLPMADAAAESLREMRGILLGGVA